MKGSPTEVRVMMRTVLKADLIEMIESKCVEMLKEEMLEQMRRMVCNKRVRDKEIAKNPACAKLYRKMFFNHYGMFWRI